MGALLVNISSYLLIDRAPHATRPSAKSVQAAIALLTFTTVVFRVEVLLLLGPLVLQALLLGHASLSNIVKTGVLSGAISLGQAMFQSRRIGLI